VALAIVAALAGLQAKGSDVASGPAKVLGTKVNSWPLAVLVVGVLCGSCLGLFARTHDWFSPDPSKIIEQWTAAGLDRRVVVNRLFDGSVAKTADQNDIRRSVLFAPDAEDSDSVKKKKCSSWTDTPDKDLRRELLGSTLPGVAQFASSTEDPKALRSALTSFVCR